jgi:hypothetical protein
MRLGRKSASRTTLLFYNDASHSGSPQRPSRSVRFGPDPPSQCRGQDGRVSRESAFIRARERLLHFANRRPRVPPPWARRAASTLTHYEVGRI